MVALTRCIPELVLMLGKPLLKMIAVNKKIMHLDIWLSIHVIGQYNTLCIVCELQDRGLDVDGI